LLLLQFVAEKLKLKFTAVFDVNADAKITLEEAQNALKLLSVNMEDALVTEIKGKRLNELVEFEPQAFLLL
jgi:hypothetical protein